jgi:hypothetical protein
MAKIKKGRCHCGAVEIEIELQGGLNKGLRCNCSLCKRKGVIMAAVPLDKLTVTKGADNLALYQWNTGVAKHYFCKTCGIYTHHQRRANPNEFSFNVGCFEGIDAAGFESISLVDGASR